MEFKILGSSSSGNCSLLKTENATVLIDAGFTGKRIVEMLEDIGESIEKVNAVFFTHEHSDHSVGLRGLSKFEHLQFFANRDTAEALTPKLTRRVNWNLFETGNAFEYKDLKVHPFAIPHDAYDPVGYIMESGNPDDFFNPRMRFAWVTDLGYIPTLVAERIRHVDVLVLESNYDTDLLEADTNRPWSIKQRIRGRHGHLSNEAAFAYLSQAESPAWKQVYLAHLSKDCNSIDRVKEVFAPLMSPGNPFNIDIIDPTLSPSPSEELA